MYKSETQSDQISTEVNLQVLQVAEGDAAITAMPDRLKRDLNVRTALGTKNIHLRQVSEENAFERMTRFEGLEVDARVLADPRALRDAYQAELGEFQTRIKSACLGGRMDYVVLDTSRHLDVALSTYLAQRAGTR